MTRKEVRDKWRYWLEVNWNHAAAFTVREVFKDFSSIRTRRKRAAPVRSETRPQFKS